MQVKITLYIRDHCSFCDRALALLSRKNAEFEIINAGRDARARAQMIENSGGRQTFPQIFINHRHIGGCDDLYALEQAGRLDALLQNDEEGRDGEREDSGSKGRTHPGQGGLS